MIVMALLLAGHVAWGQPSPADVAYEEGRRLYDLREWDPAIVKFKEAYRIRPDAKSLFNIAQAFRLKGDCVEATNFYRTYKRNFPKEKNLEKADKFITELEPCARGVKPEPVKPVKVEPVKPAKLEPVKPVQPDPVQPAWVQPDPVQPNPMPAPVFQPPPQIDRPTPIGQAQRRAGITIAIVGSVAFIGGVYFGLEARSYAQQAEDEGGFAWDPSVEQAGQAADSKAKLLLGLGGAAILGGAIVYKVAPKAGPAQLGVVPHGDGAMLVWSGKL